MEQARDSGKPVKIYYRQYMMPFPWRAGCDAIAYRVEFISPETK